MMKPTPGKYFHILRTHTLKRPHHVLYLNSVKNTFQNTTPVPSGESLSVVS